MKVALISTFPPRQCGIGNYCQQLAKSLTDFNCLKGEELSIIASHDALSLQSDKFSVHPTFQVGKNFKESILTKIDKIKPDLIHIQHAPDLFGLSRELLSLLEELDKRQIKRLITMHTVFTPFSGLLEGYPRVSYYHSKMGQHLDKIIVHQKSCAQILVSDGVPIEKIEVIPHWTGNKMAGDSTRVRKKYSIPADAPLLLFFGFIRIQKNIGILLKAMPHLLKEIPDAHLLIVGSIHDSVWYNRFYLQYLQRLRKSRLKPKQIILENRFVASQEVDDYYAAADMVLLPHRQGYGSASGVAHQAVAAAKPFVCSNIKKFEDIIENTSAKTAVPPRDARAWARSITMILKDADLKKEIIAGLTRYREQSSLGCVARAHQKVYNPVL